jgi:hypothetical protein
MDNKNAPKEPKEKRSAVEKSVSLWGASFTEVLGALLKTKPIPKGEEKKKHGENREV